MRAFSLFKWFGTITSIIGSFMVASNMLAWGYVFFTVGSISWMVIGYKIKDKPLFMLNFVFTIADFVGIYNYILT